MGENKTMTKLICPNCNFPFSVHFANLFPGNRVECTHCKRGSIVHFSGRIVEHDTHGVKKVVCGGMKYLIPTRVSGDFKGKDTKAPDTVQTLKGIPTG